MKFYRAVLASLLWSVSAFAVPPLCNVTPKEGVLSSNSMRACLGPFAKEDRVTPLVPSWVRWIVTYRTTASTAVSDGKIVYQPTPTSASDPEAGCTAAGAWGVIIPSEVNQWRGGDPQGKAAPVIGYSWPIGGGRVGHQECYYPLIQATDLLLPTPSPTP